MQYNSKVIAAIGILYTGSDCTYMTHRHTHTHTHSYSHHQAREYLPK